MHRFSPGNFIQKSQSISPTKYKSVQMKIQMRKALQSHCRNTKEI